MNEQERWYVKPKKNGMFAVKHTVNYHHVLCPTVTSLVCDSQTRADSMAEYLNNTTIDFTLAAHMFASLKHRLSQQDMVIGFYELDHYQSNTTNAVNVFIKERYSQCPLKVNITDTGELSFHYADNASIETPLLVVNFTDILHANIGYITRNTEITNIDSYTFFKNGVNWRLQVAATKGIACLSNLSTT